MKNKIVIYQTLPRLFGNKNTNCIYNGSIEQNGCGKFNDFDAKTLQRIRHMGFTHVWFTGIIRHALTNDYSLVNTNEDEFDYPDGDQNKYTRYDGKAGIKLGLLQRIVFALREKSLKLLVSTNISGKSKILINRNVVKRVTTIFPHIKYESDPYCVTVDGKLYWIVDAYTTSSHYPYSEPYTGMIVTARESPASRNRALDHGMTQLDCSSNIAIKGYSDFENEAHQEKERQQFMLGDNRSIDEMVRYLAGRGIITSFCTAGYRCGRTGGCIMDALKTGREGKFCKINAVLTFREWLDDFASPETKALGDALIEKELAGIKEWVPKFYPSVLKQYEATCRGARDLFF